MKNFNFLYACDKSLPWGRASTACRSSQGSSIQATTTSPHQSQTYPTHAERNRAMFNASVLLSVTGQTRQLGISAFVTHNSSLQLIKRFYFQLIFFCSSYLKSTDTVFPASACVQCFLLRDAVGGSCCLSTFLTCHHMQLNTAQKWKSFGCRRRNIGVNLCQNEYMACRAQHFENHCFVCSFVREGGGESWRPFHFNIHTAFPVP